MGYRTMQGKEIDMEKLMRQHELMPAIGNMKVNARGDELGPGGKIVKKREEVVAEYYEDNPNATKATRKAPVIADTPPVEVKSKNKKVETGE
jgi:hypothetical protein